MNNLYRYSFFKWLRVFLIFEFITILLLLPLYFYLDHKGMIFYHPHYLYIIALYPVLYFFFFRRLFVKIRFLDQMSNGLTFKDQTYLRVFNLKFIFLKNAVLGLIIALAYPIYGTRSVDAGSKDGEIMICLDVSNSMNVRDINDESRLEVSKRLLNGMINRLQGQKIGVCLFAGDAFVQIPTTYDYESVKTLLADVKTTFLSKQGTNVPRAMELAMASYSQRDVPRSILLVTDGENHIDIGDEVFNQIKKEKVFIYALGVGTQTGGPVPDGVTNSFKMTETGSMVISKVHADFVKNIANLCNGDFYFVDTPFPDASPLLTEINLRSKGYFRNLKIEVKKTLHHYSLLGAFMFFVLFLITPGFKLIENEI